MVVLAGEDALIEVVAGADFVGHRIDGNLPDAWIGFGWALERLAGEGRLTLKASQAVMISRLFTFAVLIMNLHR